MKQIPEPDLKDAVQLSAAELNDIRLASGPDTDD